MFEFSRCFESLPRVSLSLFIEKAIAMSDGRSLVSRFTDVRARLIPFAMRDERARDTLPCVGASRPAW